MKKISFAICISALVAGISLSIFTLFADWSTLNSEKFGLNSCRTCENLYSNWSWECLARVSCMKNELYCVNYTNGYKSGLFYTYFELGSIFAGLLLLEKLVILVCHEEFGAKFTIYTIAILHFALHAIGVISWFAYSDSNFENADIKAGYGPIVSITNGIFMGFYVSFLIFTLARSKVKSGLVRYEDSKLLLGINPKYCALIGLILVVAGGILIIAGLTSKKWLHKGEFSGGLLRCSDCNEVPDLNWSCLAGSECEINSNSANCHTYLDLSASGKTYIYLEVFAILCIIFSIQPAIGVIISRTYGFKYLFHVFVI